MFEQVITLCKEKGFRFGSFTSHLHEYIVTAIDPKLAGREPVFSEKRDYLDYMYDMDSWKRRGLILLAQDESATRAIEKAIEYLEKC